MTLSIVAVSSAGLATGCTGDDGPSLEERDAAAVAEFVDELAGTEAEGLWVSPRAAMAYAQQVCFESTTDELAAGGERERLIEPHCSDGFLLGAPLELAPTAWP